MFGKWFSNWFSKQFDSFGIILKIRFIYILVIFRLNHRRYF